MGFDETEWSKTAELPDNPDIPDDEKERIFEDYIKDLFKKRVLSFENSSLNKDFNTICYIIKPTSTINNYQSNNLHI